MHFNLARKKYYWPWYHTNATNRENETGKNVHSPITNETALRMLFLERQERTRRQQRTRKILFNQRY